MRKIFLLSVALLCAAVSCDSPPNPGPTYQPSDGRNLAPAMKDASHGDPNWPNDIDRGGGGGTR